MVRGPSRLGYWLLVLSACGLTALLFVTVVNAMVRADRAEEARNRTAASATRRIDMLNGRIVTLNTQAVENGERLGALALEVGALAEQIRQMGGRPVTLSAPRATARSGVGGSSNSSSPTPTPEPSPTTTAPPADPGPRPEPAPVPPEEPRPFPCSTVFVPVVCQ